MRPEQLVMHRLLVTPKKLPNGVEIMNHRPERVQYPGHASAAAGDADSNTSEPGFNGSCTDQSTSGDELNFDHICDEDY